MKYLKSYEAITVNKYDSKELEDDLKKVKETYPDCIVTYYFAANPLTGKRYIIQAKKDNQIVFSDHTKNTPK